MKKTKKYYRLGLAVLLALGLTACGNQNENQSNEENRAEMETLYTADTKV